MELLTKLAGYGDSLLSYILPFLFVLTLVVFFHELGHFIVARWCKVDVRVFSIGFGREIFGFDDIELAQVAFPALTTYMFPTVK